MEQIKVIQDALNQPPIPFEPEKQTLKAWAMYCLRDRGFKVVYAQNADFAIEPRSGNKIYFRVTTDSNEVNGSAIWIVWDSSAKQVNLVAS